jgi:hypothetical protein
MKTTFLVSGTHVAPEYNLVDHEIKVAPYSDLGFYADSDLLGCGKTYSSPEAAIRALCQDHAITITSIRRKE